MGVTKADWRLKLDVDESLDLNTTLVSTSSTRHAISGNNGSMTPSTAPAVEEVFSDVRQLSGGADALDLTSLTGSANEALDMTGLRVQAVKIKAAATNSAAIVVKPAASNGYNLFGDADGQQTLPPGSQHMSIHNDGLADVSGTVKAIAITSGDVDADYEIILVAGTAAA